MKRQVTVDGGGYSKRQKKNPKVYRKDTGKMSYGLQRAVNEAILKRSETKMITRNFEEYPSNTLAGNAHVLSYPTPVQGAASFNRIGNKISKVGLVTRLLLNNNSTVHMYVRMLVLEVHEGQKSNQEIEADLYEGTNDQDVAGSGTLVDQVRPINREEFRVIKDELIHLSPREQDMGVASRVFKTKLSGQMVFHDSGAALPVAKRYVCVLIIREAPNDVNMGNFVEYSMGQDFIFKE